jgi:hypothetical protein
LAKEIIGEIDPNCMIAHTHHFGAQFGFRDINDLHYLGTAHFSELNRFHAVNLQHEWIRTPMVVASAQ